MNATPAARNRNEKLKLTLDYKWSSHFYQNYNIWDHNENHIAWAAEYLLQNDSRTHSDIDHGATDKKLNVIK